MEFCTLTQGAYGNAKGKFNGIKRDAMIQNLLASGPVTLGKAGSRFITFANPASGNPNSTANCIIAVMPAGGTPNPLPPGTMVTINGSAGHTCNSIPSNLLDNGKFNNVLIGQTLALTLNIRLSAGEGGGSCAHEHDLGNLELCSSLFTRKAKSMDACIGDDDDVPDPADPGSNFNIPNSVLCALQYLASQNEGHFPTTVAGLLELANCALAGDPIACTSYGDITAALDAINKGFDECRFLVRSDCQRLDCPEGCQVAHGPSSQGPVLAQSIFPFEFRPLANSSLFSWFTADRFLSRMAISVEANTNRNYFNFGL
jgi:hypothetical protein